MHSCCIPRTCFQRLRDVVSDGGPATEMILFSTADLARHKEQERSILTSALFPVPRESASDRRHAKDELSVNSAGELQVRGRRLRGLGHGQGRGGAFFLPPDRLGLPPVLGNDDEWTSASEWTTSMWLV